MNRILEPILKVENLTKRFGGLTAVDDVSFEVMPGEILGIIGPNGAGKTTLFSMISGFLSPSSGRVFFDGCDALSTPPHVLVERGMARSFQIVQTFADMSVLEVVTAAALTRRAMRAAEDYAHEIIARVGLTGREGLTPTSLSLQDKKLLEVAKCVATEPRFILLDEVMAGLTLAETEAPLAVIRDLNRCGTTIIMVEHVMPVIMRTATRLVVIDFGKLIATGTPEEIVKDQRVIDAYFGTEVDA